MTNFHAFPQHIESANSQKPSQALWEAYINLNQCKGLQDLNGQKSIFKGGGFFRDDFSWEGEGTIPEKVINMPLTYKKHHCEGDPYMSSVAQKCI